MVELQPVDAAEVTLVEAHPPPGRGSARRLIQPSVGTVLRF